MAVSEYHGIGIAAISAAIPKRVVRNTQYQTDLFGKEAVETLVEKIGIYERRFATDGTCASDLCFQAAKKLMIDNNIGREDIDLLIFISETPDYKFPATACILQSRLGLSTSTVAFDVNMGCSAALYGLNIAYGMLSGGMRKALVMIGDTNSRIYSPEDRATAFLFGDAGVAMLVEQNEKYGKSFFSLNTDGSLHDLIMMKAGGSRYPSSQQTLISKVVDEYGNKRSEEHAWMRGSEVMEFVISNVPKDIRNILDIARLDKGAIDYYIFHQANRFINNHIAKKLKLASEKTPFSLTKYGNTGGASVPLTMITELGDILSQGSHKLLISAFGIGMSWGTAILSTVDCSISPLQELNESL